MEARLCTGQHDTRSVVGELGIAHDTRSVAEINTRPDLVLEARLGAGQHGTRSVAEGEIGDGQHDRGIHKVGGAHVSKKQKK